MPSGRAAWPTSDGEPVFAEPWEGRAFGLAFDVVRRSGATWDDFRDRLIVALDEEPERPYYESWVVALERLVTEHGHATATDLVAARRDAATYRYDDGGDPVEVMPIVPTGEALAAIGRVVGRPLSPIASHVELYVRGEQHGVRSFDGGGAGLDDIALDDATWDALVALVVS
ncbi:MAG: hypothetical protein JWM34_3385 [Ilumatobacteraceae bacterium]|nr:hypothetical protein [Ilumatobacteraceae bacterium]